VKSDETEMWSRETSQSCTSRVKESESVVRKEGSDRPRSLTEDFLRGLYKSSGLERNWLLAWKKSKIKSAKQGGLRN